MPIIALTNGYETQVDDADLDTVTAHHWYGLIQSRQVYATRSRWNPLTRRYDIVYLHRVLMQAQPGQIVDHIDRDSLNNQRSNLRLCTKSQNAMNRAAQRNCQSGYKGVYFFAGLWQANIKANGKIIILGRFESAIDAARAYDDAARRYFGEFAYLNGV